jgi:hypothetical protein
MYDSRLSESENEAIWQADNRMRIEHSMMEFFQPEDYRIVSDVMMRHYREYFQHELEDRHFFDVTFDPLSNMVGPQSSNSSPEPKYATLYHTVKT